MLWFIGGAILGAIGAYLLGCCCTGLGDPVRRRNKSVIWLSFGRWAASAGRWLIWDRLYWRGYRWTPFCRVSLRHTKGERWNCPCCKQAEARITELEQVLSAERDARLRAEADVAAVREQIRAAALAGILRSVDLEQAITALEKISALCEHTPTPGTAVLRVVEAARADETVLRQEIRNRALDGIVSAENRGQMVSVLNKIIELCESGVGTQLADALAALPGGTDGGKQSE